MARGRIILHDSTFGQVASAEQSAQDAQTAAEKAASVLAAALARENCLLCRNSPHKNTASHGDGGDAKNDVDKGVNSSHAAVRSAREEAERSEEVTSLAAAELASAVAAVAAEACSTADSHSNSKALSNDIWDVDSAREDENTFEDQEQAAAAAGEEARNVAAALEERRRALQALETGSAEATALVRASLQVLRCALPTCVSFSLVFSGMLVVHVFAFVI